MANYSWMSASRKNSPPSYVEGSEEFTVNIGEGEIDISVYFENSPYGDIREGEGYLASSGEYDTLLGTFKCEWEASQTGNSIKTELRELEIRKLHIYNEGFDDYDEGQYSEGEEYSVYPNFVLSWVDDEIENEDVSYKTEMTITIDCYDSLDIEKWRATVLYQMSDRRD
jgi:hypothetical protein